MISKQQYSVYRNDYRDNLSFSKVIMTAVVTFSVLSALNQHCKINAAFVWYTCVQNRKSCTKNSWFEFVHC